MKKPIICYPYRSEFNDCSNGGVTSVHHKFYLFKEGTTKDEVIEFLEKLEGDILYRMDMCLIFTNPFKNPIYTGYIEPVFKETLHTEPGNWMCGGNFVWTSDSRWKEYTHSDAPVRVHDRFEPIN